jgi:Glycosyl hydrolase family 26
MWPERSGGSFAAAARGDDDTHWRTYGANLTATGRYSQLTSLAWEFNGTWFEWSVRDDPAGYAAAYRRIVWSVRQTCPGARFAWVMNAGSGDPTAAYPGDDYVDMVGTDQYDMWPPSLDDASWQQRISQPAALQWAYDFAVAHGKPFGVFEWGLAHPKDANHGGDNPYYIKRMLDWMRAHPGVLEMYFDAVGSTDSLLAHNPNGAAMYRQGLTP